MAVAALAAALLLSLSLCRGAGAGAGRRGHARHADEREQMPLCNVSVVMAGGDWVDISSGQPLTANPTGSPDDFSWENRLCHPKSSAWPSHLQLSHLLTGRRILFLGDSTMGHLHKAFASHLGCLRPHRLQQDRCSLARYYGLPGAHTYPHGTKELGEGPFKLGVMLPGCTDCSGCKSMAQHCGNGSVVEYITMEHPRDKTVSSEALPTSQDVLLRHHLRSHPADVVVLNFGLHAMSMCSFERFHSYFPGRSLECWRRRAEIFTEDVRGLIQQLQSTSALVIWVTINSVNDSLQIETRLPFSSDANVRYFNSALEDTLKELKAPVVDTYRMSNGPFAMGSLHSDPVHLKKFKSLYYRKLAIFIALAMMENSGMR